MQYYPKLISNYNKNLAVAVEFWIKDLNSDLVCFGHVFFWKCSIAFSCCVIISQLTEYQTSLNAINNDIKYPPGTKIFQFKLLLNI